MNSENLKPAAHRLTVEELSRGGKRSAEVRRQKQQLRKVVEDIFNGTYTDKTTGDVMTAEEIICKKLMTVVCDTRHPKWFDVIGLLIKLTDSDISENELALREASSDFKLRNLEAEQAKQEQWDNIFSNLI